MQGEVRSAAGVCLAIALALGIAGVPSAAEAQSTYYDDEAGSGDDAGSFSLKTGLGFTASPTAFLLGFEADYRIVDPVSVGLLTELGINDDVTIVSPVLYGRYWPDLGALIDPDLDPIEPYLHAGFGGTWWDADTWKGVDDDDGEFLMNFGFGVEYRFTPHVSLGTQMLFNIIPGEIHDDSRIDDKFYYSWQVLGVRYRF